MLQAEITHGNSTAARSVFVQTHIMSVRESQYCGMSVPRHVNYRDIITVFFELGRETLTEQSGAATVGIVFFSRELPA